MLNLSPLATWLATAFDVYSSISSNSDWPNVLFLTGFAASMAVNTLVTGLIVFRILKVTAGIEPTSVEQILGSCGGNKFRHIIFIIIESAMALFAIQLTRVVLGFSPVPVGQESLFVAAEDIAISINEMLNVIIIISIHFYFFCLLITFT